MRLHHALFSVLLLQLTLSLGVLGTSTLAVAQTATQTTQAPSLPGRPLWSDLSESQQQALAPLSEQWPTMNEPHKRKWLALSQNFAQLSADEQATVQAAGANAGNALAVPCDVSNEDDVAKLFEQVLVLLRK